MATHATEQKTAGGAAESGGAPPVEPSRPGLIALLASVRLTLWLLAILVIAMSIATLIPQNAPPENYARAFGEVPGGFIARTTLHNIYGSWWFIAAFVVLAVNLLACVLRRTGQLLSQDSEAPARVTRGDTQARGQRAAWRASAGVEETADALSASLKKRGYAVRLTPGEEEGQRGLVARRGRLARWTPVIVHVGMLVVLIGAGWGKWPGWWKWPSHMYRATAELRPGETFPVRVGDDAFGVRLVDAGSKYDATGQPSDFWAKAEVVEESRVVRSVTIRPNHPLRYHGISVVLQSLGRGEPAPAGFALEVSKGGSRERVPISITSDGAVDPMGSYRRLGDPAWIVIVTDLRRGDESGKGGPMASVMIDTGEPSPEGQMPNHTWQSVGWVGEGGTDISGAHLRLAHGEEAVQPSTAPATTVQFSLDRDIGLPIVYAGFIAIALGTVLLLSNARGSVVALIAKKGQGSQVFLGASRSGPAKSMDSLLEQLQAEASAAGDAGTAISDTGER